MDATEFVKKWAATTLKESSASQSHFIDLCALLREAPPTADPSGDDYMFEKGATTPGGNGFADVWKRDHFGWEYKSKGKDLVAAYAQLQRYRESLANPPLLVVCDLDRLRDAGLLLARQCISRGARDLGPSYGDLVTGLQSKRGAVAVQLAL